MASGIRTTHDMMKNALVICGELGAPTQRNPDAELSNAMHAVHSR